MEASWMGVTHDVVIDQACLSFSNMFVVLVLQVIDILSVYFSSET